MHSCTEMACMDTYHSVALEPASGWDAGDYVVRIEADGSVQTCEGQVAEGSCGLGPMTCTGASLATVNPSGCADLGQPAHATIDFRTTPSIVQITITKDGVALADRQVALSYSTDEPNGPDCPPVCHHAEGKAEVTF